mgnify:CR=1 FL=1
MGENLDGLVDTLSDVLGEDTIGQIQEVSQDYIELQRDLEGGSGITTEQAKEQAQIPFVGRYSSTPRGLASWRVGVDVWGCVGEARSGIFASHTTRIT